MLKVFAVGLMTLVRHEVLRIFRIWPQTVIPPVISIILYLTIFGKIIGNNIIIGSNISYVNFIMPGLLMMFVINSSFTNVVTSVFIARFQKYIEEILVSPLPLTLIVAGYICGGIFRSIIISIIMLIIMYLFLHMKVQHPMLMIILFLLSSILFSLAGFINGLLARNFDDTMIFNTFLLNPLVYTGGVFYTLDMLPPILQSICIYNPIFYVIEGFRYSILGFSNQNVWNTFTILVVLLLILFFINIRLLQQGIGIRK